MIARDKNIYRKVSRLLANFRRTEAVYRQVKLPLKTEEDFRRLPITSREDMSTGNDRNHVEDVFNVTATSGTTDSRLLISHSRKCHQVHIRRLVKLYRSVGISSRDRCLNLCSYSLNSGGRLMEVAYKAAGAGVIPLGVLDSPEKIREAVAIIGTLRPTVVNSYTNQLYDLFSVLGRKHSIRDCIVNGEPLTRAFKCRIEELGGVRIYDHYGAMEVSGFAIAQKHSDEYMKIFDDGLIIEVLHDDGISASSGQGAIVVTDLENRAMPFVRYSLGDRVDICKRRDGYYIKVLGRLADSLLIDGQTCSVSSVVRSVQDILLHPYFCIVVDKDKDTYKDHILVNVPSEDISRSAEIRGAFRKFVDMGNRLVVHSFRGVFPRTSSGKFKHIVDVRKDREKV